MYRRAVDQFFLKKTIDNRKYRCYITYRTRGTEKQPAPNKQTEMAYNMSNRMEE